MALRDLSTEELREKARRLRGEMLVMLQRAGSGHPGGALSSMDLLTVLYNNVMRHDPKNPGWADRDRYVVSKGHVCPALYVVLADCGYFEKKELKTLRKLGSILQGHPYMGKTPGLYVSSGSLGQGLSVAVGMAIAAKADHRPIRVYSLMGDGEQQEGQIWEAAMAAGQYKLDNLCGIVDYNGLQIDGAVEDVMDIAPLADKWRAFNWNVIELDGHSMEEIQAAFSAAEQVHGKPTVLIARTVKGKGVSFMENNASWHGAAPNSEQLAAALQELGYKEDELCADMN